MHKNIQAHSHILVYFLLLIIFSFLIALTIFPTFHIQVEAQNLEENSKDDRIDRKGHEQFQFQFEIRILVVVDSTMKDFHQGDLNEYLQNVFDFVSKFYKESASVLEHLVHVKVFKYHTILDDLIIPDDMNKFNQSGKNQSGSIEALNLLERFCDWKTIEENNFDAAILLTRRSLSRKSIMTMGGSGIEASETVGDVLGVANYGSLCTTWSCAVIRDYAPYTFFNLVHEIGHLLHMHDDESEYCQTLEPNIKLFGEETETENESYVMESTRYLDKISTPDFQSTIKWSNCSKIYLKNFLRSSDSSCIQASENEILL